MNNERNKAQYWDPVAQKFVSIPVERKPTLSLDDFPDDPRPSFVMDKAVDAPLIPPALIPEGYQQVWDTRRHRYVLRKTDFINHRTDIINVTRLSDSSFYVYPSVQKWFTQRVPSKGKSNTQQYG